MSKVVYKLGTKATYLGLLERPPNALYFCTDTKELFKGDDLYSDGLRLVGSYDELPAFIEAADGILYFCQNTGSGYVLNETRDAWLPVVHGVDNETIVLNEKGLMSIKAVPVEAVTGLGERLEEVEQKVLDGVSIATLETAGIVKASSEIFVAEDGTMGLSAIPQVKIIGLEDRLTEIEQSIAGGVHYRGAVETFADLPTNASQGDLYEVRVDNSEWCYNGEQWFEYGKTTDATTSATKDEIRAIAQMVDYEISSKPIGTLVNYMEEEIRIMCPTSTKWSHQQSGEGSDPNTYYVGFKAYAPSNDVVSFKEDLAEIISDATMYYFENNEFAGIDEYGRKYSIVWLPVASYDEPTDSWTYYGANSSDARYIGWHYSVEWYNIDGIKIASDTIRINLTNENCHANVMPYYMANIQATMAELEESYTWTSM